MAVLVVSAFGYLQAVGIALLHTVTSQDSEFEQNFRMIGSAAWMKNSLTRTTIA
jgi:hypothetical protein